ncbi:hypothetical protein NM688_g2041 [Phlebia brevispora]|uniref:Uncharacterized protein n=1 Tax=Phlebia brevispora TaxID=194682 RepID=A0ACC1T9W5_9APHY|nr:hypothetical protein NM688_g2041 [Phlebia brevispora]
MQRLVTVALPYYASELDASLALGTNRSISLAWRYIYGIWRIGKMSTTASDAEIISKHKANLTYNYSATAVLAIVCYEFVLTFRHEYKLVWKRRWTGATWLFLANRCDNYRLGYFLAVIENLPGIITAVFSTLRVFALLGRAWTPAVFTFALGLFPVALDFYQRAQATYYYPCFTTLAGTLSTIAADITAIVITWIKTYRHVREASSVGANVGFGEALLRYGALVLLAPSLVPADPIETLTTTLPSIILSRFLINLRQINAPESGSAARFSHFSPPNFRMPSIPSIIGNLGEPLADNEDEVDDEDHVIADTYEGGTGTGANSDDEVGTSGVVDIDIGEIEEVWHPPYLDRRPLFTQLLL